jgi:hypothetical protein
VNDRHAYEAPHGRRRLTHGFSSSAVDIVVHRAPVRGCCSGMARAQSGGGGPANVARIALVFKRVHLPVT